MPNNVVLIFEGVDDAGGGVEVSTAGVPLESADPKAPKIPDPSGPAQLKAALTQQIAAHVLKFAFRLLPEFARNLRQIAGESGEQRLYRRAAHWRLQPQKNKMVFHVRGHARRFLRLRQGSKDSADLP